MSSPGVAAAEETADSGYDSTVIEEAEQAIACSQGVHLSVNAKTASCGICWVFKGGPAESGGAKSVESVEKRGKGVE